MRLFKKSKPAGRLGLEVSPFGMSVALLQAHDDEGDRERCECGAFEGTNLAELASEVGNWASDRDVLEAPCRVVLHPSYYSLYFVERPEGIDDSLENVVIDTFPVPDDAFHGRSRMLYAVTARRALIEEIAASLEDVGMEIESIDITELVTTGNVLRKLDEEGRATAMLRMRKSFCRVLRVARGMRGARQRPNFGGSGQLRSHGGNRQSRLWALGGR